MHIAIITAGGAGMFCGSCMHDNTWARALQARGLEVSLIPLYTPIRVDEEDVSTRHVFFGGINVYLESHVPMWRYLPRPLTRVLDHPGILSLATRLGVSNDARKLGGMTVDMLEGERGPTWREVEELAGFLAHALKPDVVFFSNALLSGTIPRLKQEYSGKIYCILQGDDIFLDALQEPYRSQAIAKIREHARHFDGFVTHSRYYRDFMVKYFDLPPEKFHILPLGIDLEGHVGLPRPEHNSEFTIGYFARLCPEKGLDRLVEGFELLHARRPKTKLRVGGYLGKKDARWFRQLQRRTRRLGEAFEYVGSPPDHDAKVEFLCSLDLLSVPTAYREPKGLYVLEALANGVPVVEPSHGAFPEMIEATGGGVLVEPGNPEAWAQAVDALIGDSVRWSALSETGYKNVRELYSAERMADDTLAMLDFAQAPPLRAAEASSR